MAARHSFNTFPASPFLTPTVPLFSLLPPLALPSLAGAKAKAEISPRACGGDWYQIAVKMEMPIKLTAHLQPPSFPPSR